MSLCLLSNVGFAGLASLFLLHIFLSLFGKKGGDTSMCTFSYVKFYVDVDIANICSVLLKNRRLSSCRLFVSASFLVFFSFSKKWWVFPCKRFHISCLRLMLRLLTFVL